MAKLSAEAVGLISLVRHLGEEKIGKVWADSSSAIAIVNRLGAGNLRHIHIGSLLIQEIEEDCRLQFHTAAGVANCADLMTKNVSRQARKIHVRFIVQAMKVGTAAAGLQLSRGDGQEENAERPKF